MAAAFFGIHLAMSVTITRVRAELGPPAHDLYNAGPDLMLMDFLGTRCLGTQYLSVMTLFFWLNHLSYRAHPMPHQLDALKLAHHTNFDRRWLLFALVIAIAVGRLSASCGHLHISYRMGLEQEVRGMRGRHFTGWRRGRISLITPTRQAVCFHSAAFFFL